MTRHPSTEKTFLACLIDSPECTVMENSVEYVYFHCTVEPKKVVKPLFEKRPENFGRPKYPAQKGSYPHHQKRVIS